MPCFPKLTIQFTILGIIMMTLPHPKDISAGSWVGIKRQSADFQLISLSLVKLNCMRVNIN